MRPLKPNEILDATIENMVVKANGSFLKLFLLAIIAGGFVGLAGGGSNMGAFNLLLDPNLYGLGRCLAGAMFSAALILIVLSGGELFTGNTLIIVGVAEKRVTVKKMLRNWVIVYIGNFIGCAALALMWQHSGLLSSGADMLGAMTVKIAAGKCNLEFLPAFLMGILCNWLVCLGVWMATGAEGFAGKIVGMFFPIWIFVTSGFEHCVANMYYVPAGIFAKVNETYVQLSGVSEAALQNLTWAGFFVNNLIPVTLGNIIGGGVCVGLAYWVAYKKA